MPIGLAAFRGPGRDLSVNGVRPVQPVVRRFEPERPVAGARPPASSYTPQTRAADTPDLYSRKGTPAASSGVFTASSWERTDTFELQVRTAEGDVATLRFSQSGSAVAADADVRTVAGRAQTTALQALQDSSLEVEVQGNLSESERVSINRLASQVRTVADDFFEGDMAGAMQSAGRIDIRNQDDTLQAYAFSIRSTEMRMAAAIYEDVARSTAALNVQVPQANPKPIAPPPPAAEDNGTKGLLKELLAMFDRFTGTVQTPATS